MENNLLELAKNRRSCRRYTGEKISEEIVTEIMVDKSDCELWIEDAAVASTYILLAAEQFGIGACWIHMRNRAGQMTTADEEIRQLLGVPNKFSVLNVVALGGKAENKSARTDKDISWKNVHYEKF